MFFQNPCHNAETLQTHSDKLYADGRSDGIWTASFIAVPVTAAATACALAPLLYFYFKRRFQQKKNETDTYIRVIAEEGDKRLGCEYHQISYGKTHPTSVFPPEMHSFLPGLRPSLAAITS